MAVVPRLKTEEIDNLGDITRNLPSLQFESALFASEKDIIYLRQRSHAHTVAVCAQATYYVTVLNEARQICRQLKNPTARKATRILQGASAKEAMKIGIIGCGRVGSHLAHCLLSFAEINPDELCVSTRRPETLIGLQEKGVACISSNVDIAKRCHILFLCVLPSQFPAVAEDIKGHINKDCIIFSMISALALPRMKQLMEYSNVIRPEFDWGESGDKLKWDYTLEVTATFAKEDLLEQTCPLSLHKDESVIITKEKFAEQMVYGFVNMCTQLELPRSETVDVLNAVMLGHTTRRTPEESIQQGDITKYCPPDNQYFPHFDLSATLNRDTPITQALVNNKQIQEAFVKRYCFIFKQYLDWKNTALAQARKQLQFSFD